MVWILATGLGCRATTDPPEALPVPIVGDLVRCDQRPLPLVDLIRAATNGLVHQRIPYGPADEWRDCSGNFLRLSSYLARACPDQRLAAPAGVADYVEGGDNRVPLIPEARSSRDLARWHHSEGRFVPVWQGDDPTDHQDRIVPGTVLWFSGRTTPRDQGDQALFDSIAHMGIVTAVEHDEAGALVAYRMYHGRSRGKLATVTRHRRDASPAFGVGRQGLVGIGTILPPWASD